MVNKKRTIHKCKYQQTQQFVNKNQCTSDAQEILHGAGYLGQLTGKFYEIIHVGVQDISDIVNAPQYS